MMKVYAVSVFATVLGVLICSTATTRAKMVAYWPLNDGTNGQVVAVADDVIDDPSHPATDATSNGSGNTWTNDAQRGIVLSTTENYRLSAGQLGITYGVPYTWSLWVKSTDTVTTGEFPDDDSAPNVIIGGNSNGSVKLMNHQMTGSSYSLTGFELSDGVWHHVAVRNLGTSVEIYIDGVFVDDDTSIAQPSDDILQIGGKGGYSEDFTGLISDVAIWDEALTVKRIQGLANGEQIYLPRGTTHSQR